jgi:hypothetical protein
VSIPSAFRIAHCHQTSPEPPRPVDVEVNNVEPEPLSREAHRLPQILLAQQNADPRRNKYGRIEYGALPVVVWMTVITL